MSLMVRTWLIEGLDEFTMVQWQFTNFDLSCSCALLEIYNGDETIVYDEGDEVPRTDGRSRESILFVVFQPCCFGSSVTMEFDRVNIPPSTAPTDLPMPRPSTSPTFTPTAHPTTNNPTLNPTAHRTTNNPTLYPTAFAPTNNPTLYPTAFAQNPPAFPQNPPTFPRSPSLAPSIVVCCGNAPLPATSSVALCNRRDVDNDGIEDCVDEEINVAGLKMLSKYVYDLKEGKVVGKVTIPSVSSLREPKKVRISVLREDNMDFTAGKVSVVLDIEVLDKDCKKLVIGEDLNRADEIFVCLLPLEENLDPETVCLGSRFTKDQEFTISPEMYALLRHVFGLLLCGTTTLLGTFAIIEKSRNEESRSEESRNAKESSSTLPVIVLGCIVACCCISFGIAASIFAYRLKGRRWTVNMSDRLEMRAEDEESRNIPKDQLDLLQGNDMPAVPFVDVRAQFPGYEFEVEDAGDGGKNNSKKKKKGMNKIHDDDKVVFDFKNNEEENDDSRYVQLFLKRDEDWVPL